MKSILFRTAEGQMWIRRNTMDDALDLDRFPNSKIGSFRSLFGTRSERDGKDIAKKLVHRMSALIAHDLVESNDVFVLPRRRTGYLVVTDLAKAGMDIEKYKMDPITGPSTIYGGLVRLDKFFQKTTGVRKYFFKLTEKWCERMRELRLTENRTWS